MKARAVILFGHGSRDPLWRQPMDAVAERIARAAPRVEVRCAFLELQQPDLGTAGRELAEAGIQDISIVPMFLGTGKHAREDLPVLVDALRAALPEVSFSLRRPVGEDGRLLDLIAQVAIE